MEQALTPEPPFANRRRRRDAAVELCIWQIEFDVSNKELSAALGCHEDHVARLRRGIMKPGRRLAVAIETVTGIPIPSWEK